MSLNGHGVGMSAKGAIGQANEGKTAAEILSYYYQGTSLLSLY
jgi:stage II sporulation protein D